MRATEKLTARAVQTIKTPGRHSDGGNLYLVVDASGARRWVFIYRWNGRIVEMGLGGVDRLSLKDARARAQEARKALGAGQSPLEIKRAAVTQAQAAQRRVTFGEAADAYIHAHEAGWKNDKHAAQWKMTLAKYAAPLRPKAVAEVETADVLAVLQPHWQARPETAARLRNRIELVLDAARAAGHRSGENPARWRGHLDKLLPRRAKHTKGHHAALPYADIPGFMLSLRADSGIPARLLEFIVLTACRFSEAAEAKWTEFEKGIWTVPAARMKAGREHRVPLSSRAKEIVEEMRAIQSGELVFPGARGGKPVSSTGLAKVLARHAHGVTIHGFRSAFRDWAGDKTSFPREVAEAALAHVLSDKTEAAYRRSDALERRRELMEAWARFCDVTSSNVVSLRSLT